MNLPLKSVVWEVGVGAVGHLEKREGCLEILSLRNSGIVTDFAFRGPCGMCVCVCAHKVGSGGS